MTTGRNSIVKFIKVPHHNSAVPFIVKVHANKNYGICNIELCEKSKEMIGKKTVTVFTPIRRISEVISEFQGRQYNAENVMIHLYNVLSELLNA